MPLQVSIPNDDVLREVADYLHGRNALYFSLTSKRVYDLAIHRVSALIECKDQDKLRLLHRNMVYDNPTRAKHIRKLVIHKSVLTYEELYGPDDDSDSEIDWDGWERVRRKPKPPVAPLIVELLRLASNIRSLTIHCFDALRASDPGVLASMTALGRLSRLELSKGLFHRVNFDKDNTWMGFLQTSSWHLVALSLGCYIQHDDRFYPLLFGAIAVFPQLLALRLIGFDPRQSFLELDYAKVAPSFPSIRKLFLEDVTPAAFDLVGLCPSVSLVSVSTESEYCNRYGLRDEEYDDIERDAPRALGPQWNPLRSLTLSSRASMRGAGTLLAPAFHLQVTRPMSVDQDGRGDPPNMVLLLNTFRKVSPVRAQLSLIIGMDSEAAHHLWKLVPEVAPRLRFLELKINLEWGSELDNLPNALRPLRLVCLRLHLTMPLPSDLGTDEYGPIYIHASGKQSQEIHDKLVQKMKKLPRRCAGAIRSLKYIAIADEGQRDYCDGWESADERYGSEADEYEYQGGWYAEKIQTLRWWRVERSVKKRWRKTKLRPLTPEKGRAVQRFLEEADFESIERIDELLP